MKKFEKYKFLLRKSPVARTLAYVLIFFAAFFLLGAIGKKVKKKPVIYEVTPLIGVPGDTMTIRGSGFGSNKSTSFVEIAGSKITSSGFISWTDTEIKFIIPSNVQDGLVYVGTGEGISEPEFFANELLIPVAVKDDPKITVPVVASVSPTIAVPGQVIKISGSNFGSSRGNSLVYFTANRDEKISNAEDPSFIGASDFDFDYELWSDSEIQVRIPDGAASGNVYVQTNRGSSGAKKITVNFPAGRKKYGAKRTYVVQYSTEVALKNPVKTSDALNENNSLSLYVPRPIKSSFQPNVELNEYSIDPLITDDTHNLIYQQSLLESRARQIYSQNFIVTSCSVSNELKPSLLGSYNKKSELYLKYTSSDPYVQSDDPRIKTLLSAIIGSSHSSYEIAKKIYLYIIKNYKLEKDYRPFDADFLDLLRRKRGDAYDFAMIFASLCRCSGIPCVPVSGIIVDKNSSVKLHWWAEIYFEGYGWFPVDVVLGSGMEFETFAEIENPQEFYFGSIDNQHVAFSRGYHQTKQSYVNSTVVSHPRFYALQTIWEEAAGDAKNYVSHWNIPVVTGIY